MTRSSRISLAEFRGLILPRKVFECHALNFPINTEPERLIILIVIFLSFTIMKVSDHCAVEITPFTACVSHCILTTVMQATKIQASVLLELMGNKGY